MPRGEPYQVTSAITGRVNWCCGWCGQGYPTKGAAWGCASTCRRDKLEREPEHQLDLEPGP